MTAVDWGLAARTLPGAATSGDLHLVKAVDNRILFAVVDGLGHGIKAAMAAKTAVSVINKYASDSIGSLVKRCHGTLMMSRGAVMTLASLDVPAARLSWLGVGNVEGVLLRGDAAAIPSSERLLLHGGLVGYQLPKLQVRSLRVSPGDLLVLATDGIDASFAHDPGMNEPAAKFAGRILKNHFKGNDDALVLAMRYLGAKHE
ncbi:MAG: hypothetical protein JWR26_1944 [Pedosphaera sp.]|nr:hypothetical protein [Pedosphaera sp.]